MKPFGYVDVKNRQLNSSNYISEKSSQVEQNKFHFLFARTDCDSVSRMTLFTITVSTRYLPFRILFLLGIQILFVFLNPETSEVIASIRWRIKFHTIFTDADCLEIPNLPADTGDVAGHERSSMWYFSS